MIRGGMALDSTGNGIDLRRLWKDRRYGRLGLLAFVFFAYGLGVIQDAYYGVRYLINLIQGGRREGSFPFMLGWTFLMLWGIRRPLERRIVLLLTAVLVVFMFVEDLVQFAAGTLQGFPFVRIAGIALWMSGYFAACALNGHGKN